MRIRDSLISLPTPVIACAMTLAVSEIADAAVAHARATQRIGRMAYNRLGADKYGEFDNGEQKTPDRIAGKNLFYRDLRKEGDDEYKSKRRKNRPVRKV